MHFIWMDFFFQCCRGREFHCKMGHFFAKTRFNQMCFFAWKYFTNCCEFNSSLFPGLANVHVYKEKSQNERDKKQQRTIHTDRWNTFKGKNINDKIYSETSTWQQGSKIYVLSSRNHPVVRRQCETTGKSSRDVTGSRSTSTGRRVWGAAGGRAPPPTVCDQNETWMKRWPKVGRKLPIAG